MFSLLGQCLKNDNIDLRPVSRERVTYAMLEKPSQVSWGFFSCLMSRSVAAYSLYDAERASRRGAPQSLLLRVCERRFEARKKEEKKKRRETKKKPTKKQNEKKNLGLKDCSSPGCLHVWKK